MTDDWFAGRRHWVVLFAGWLVAVGYTAFLIAPASVLPLMAREFGIRQGTAGLSISAVYLSWALLQLPGGLVLDRYDNRRLVPLGVGCYLLAAVGCLLAPSYPVFLLARLVGGVAALVLWTGGANIVSSAFPAETRALGTSVFVASAPVGFAVGQSAGPLLAGAFGWRAVFPAYALLTLVAFPLYWVASTPAREDASLSVRGFLSALRNPAVLALSAASFCAYSLFLFFNSWMPAYATDELGIGLAVAGTATALFPLASALARPSGGWLSDRLGGRRRLVVAGSFLCSLPLFLVVVLARTPLVFATALLCAGFVSQLSVGVLYVYVDELSAAGTAGTSLAVLTTLSVTGSLVAPALSGWLVEAFSWQAAFVYAGALSVAGLALTLAAPRA
ncbi:MAG: nitrate/nitrite transporter [Haloarculaceae archaeon]